MARVTVEDCKKIIPNHFELVVLASCRGRDISTGSPILVERNNDKNAVVSLREIATKKLNVTLMRENFIQSFRKHRHVEENFDDNKQENYLELDSQESDKFMQNFDDDLADELGFSIDEDSISEDEMVFEDEDLAKEE